MSKPLRTIRDLTPDPHNANRGTERGLALLEHSLRQYGAGRSILADKNGMLIAGNKTAQVAEELGLAIREIETDGTELVVVRRTDLDLMTDTAAQELAIADNRVGQVGLQFDPARLQALCDATVDLTAFWSEDELKKVMAAPVLPLGLLPDDDPPLAIHAKPAAECDRIPLSIVLNTYEARRWREYKESIDETDDKKALWALLETV